MTLAHLAGRADRPAGHQLPRILELESLTKLGVAGHRSWYAWQERELRIDVEVPPVALNDSLGDGKVVVHVVEEVPERMVDEADPERPWAKGQRTMQPARQVDRYFRASVLPAGSYREAVERDQAAASRAERRKADAPARQRRLELANARAKWLAGFDVPLAELGLEELERPRD